VVILLLRRSTAALDQGETRAAPRPILAPRIGRTILIVDDDDPVRRLTRETLELLGYRVLEADSGAKALDMLETLHPDLMLFDYAMPGMNGAELARLARAKWPETPIVIASGHADTAQIEAALGGEANLLRKPFNMEALAQTIAELLQESEPGGASDA
jgi:CheY-like chemotaxis protein